MRRILLLASALSLTGCALTDAQLDVSHDPAAAQEGPIAEVESIIFVPGEIADLREDTERIGYKKNGFGMNTADITTDKPVGEIVRDAIVHAIETNGHAVGDTGIGISGSVSNFWVDLDQNFWSVEVIGNIATSLTFTDTESGDVLYSRDYKGSYSDKVQVVTNSTYDDAISGAVANLIDEIVFDEDLAEALRERSP